MVVGKGQTGATRDVKVSVVYLSLRGRSDRASLRSCPCT